MDSYSRQNSQSNILNKLESELYVKSIKMNTEFYKLMSKFYALNSKYRRLNAAFPFDSTYKQMNSEYNRLFSEIKEFLYISKYQNFYLNCKELSEYDYNCEIFKLKSKFFYEIFEKIRINNELNRLIDKYETHIQDYENLNISKLLKKLFI
jgi:uncharacterized protein YdcH (DUF465 family)